MPTLTIKGLPDAVYRRLKAQAAAHHRSLNGEIITCLERAVAAGMVDAAGWLEAAEALRQRAKVRPLGAQDLRTARRAGRA